MPDRAIVDFLPLAGRAYPPTSVAGAALAADARTAQVCLGETQTARSSTQQSRRPQAAPLNTATSVRGEAASAVRFSSSVMAAVRELGGCWPMLGDIS
jgi:hypothetical protein